MKKQSRRLRLREYAETGRLRDHLSFHQKDEEVVDLIVDLCLRYCEPRPTSTPREGESREE